MKKIDTVILGAGLTGLSVAARLGNALPDEEIIILEKTDFVGGLCRSIIKDGFTYDYSGHLLHLRKEETRRWVFELLKNNLIRVERDSRIFSQKSLTHYPYQMNLYGLPLPTIKECLSGLVSAHLKGNTPNPDGSFLKWSSDVFGGGITKHFMKPYNEKLFGLPSTQFNAQWCGGFVPRPSIEETFSGAITPLPFQKKVGYNATFFYPRRHGIQSLIDALYFQAQKHSCIKTGLSPTRIDLSSKKLTLSDGNSIEYRRLVSTIPLKDFAQLCGMKKLSAGLRATDVICFNIGVKGSAGHKIHWIYFPERKFNFYRVGFYSNINPASAPRNCYSMYVEVSISPSERREELLRILDKSIIGLRQAHLLSFPSDIISLDVRYMPNAYVIYDFNRTKILHEIQQQLQKMGDVYLAGRYGQWKYSYMEESLYEAIQLADRIKRKNSFSRRKA